LQTLEALFKNCATLTLPLWHRLSMPDSWVINTLICSCDLCRATCDPWFDPLARVQCRRTLQAAVLEHLIPPDAPAAAHELVSLWPPPDGSPATRKGTGVLLGCATPAVCDRLFGPFERQVASGPCAGCVLHVTVSAHLLSERCLQFPYN